MSYLRSNVTLGITTLIIINIIAPIKSFTPPSYSQLRRHNNNNIIHHSLLHLTPSSSSPENDNPSTTITTLPTIDDDNDDDNKNTPTNTKSYHNTSVAFPSYTTTLRYYTSGQSLTSAPFTTTSNGVTHRWCLVLYPRGGGHYRRNSNIIKKYFVSPDDDAVGIYLRRLPSEDGDDDDDDSFVDATFALQLRGNQSTGPRFDVEWRGGMRFVRSDEFADIGRGVVTDFGAHVMQSRLLPTFLGDDDDDDDDGLLEVLVSLTIHNTGRLSDVRDEGRKNRGFVERLIPRDIRHDEEDVRIGKIVVPLLTSLSQRNDMFARGVYPGVEYRIMRILAPPPSSDDDDNNIDDDDDSKDDDDENVIFSSVPSASYELKPIYSLVPTLERTDWPVRIPERSIPKLVTPRAYNALSAAGSLVAALVGLAVAWSLTFLFSFYVIPSKSMDPTLRVGDVLLVEKISPRVKGMMGGGVGDVVLFPPPEKLKEIVEKSGGRLNERDLFVKRIAAVEGDDIVVKRDGMVTINGKVPMGRRDLCEEEPLRLIEGYVKETAEGEPPRRVGKGEVFVLGDCADVLIDSRVWGVLKKEDVVGRPVGRVWPPSGWGVVGDLPGRD